DVAEKSIRQFTNSQKSETSPQWSPDGKHLAFLSGRNGDAQIFLMDINGGEALQLTNAKTDVSAFAWNPAGKTIAYLAEAPATEAEEKRQAEKNDDKVISESVKPTGVFIIDVNSK